MGPLGPGISLEEALPWLESHVNLEAIEAGRSDAPTLERMRQLVGLMGEPQRAYPVLHLTGTNGKGSTARMLSSLLAASGLSVGTYTSPNVERINERLAWNGDPIDDGSFAELLGVVGALEPLMGEKPSRFEILTAAAYRWFADVAVDVAVVEVGLGGRWDATNVADGEVCVVTNVSLDHVEILGPTVAEIAAEKAGIVKPASTLVLGETDPELVPVFRGAGAASVWERGAEFDCDTNQMAHGGRLLDLRTPGATYGGVFLPLHGAHQGDNAACALAAAEAFFGTPLDPSVVEEGFADVRVPARMEVVRRRPLCILDGAHNPAGIEAAGATLGEDFSVEGRTAVVMGVLRGREPHEMLSALGTERIDLVVACPPPSPRALPPEEVAKAAVDLGIEGVVRHSVPQAVEEALRWARPDDLLLVTGSMYVAGDARSYLLED